MAKKQDGAGQEGELGKGRLTADFCTHSSTFSSPNLPSVVTNAVCIATAAAAAVWKEEE